MADRGVVFDGTDGEEYLKLTMDALAQVRSRCFTQAFKELTQKCDQNPWIFVRTCGAYKTMKLTTYFADRVGFGAKCGVDSIFALQQNNVLSCRKHSSVEQNRSENRRNSTVLSSSHFWEGSSTCKFGSRLRGGGCFIPVFLFAFRGSTTSCSM